LREVGELYLEVFSGQSVPEEGGRSEVRVRHGLAVGVLEVTRVGHYTRIEDVYESLRNVIHSNGGESIAQNLTGGKCGLSCQTHVNAREGHQGELPDVA